MARRPSSLYQIATWWLRGDGSSELDSAVASPPVRCDVFAREQRFWAPADGLVSVGSLHVEMRSSGRWRRLRVKMTRPTLSDDEDGVDLGPALKFFDGRGAVLTCQSPHRCGCCGFSGLVDTRVCGHAAPTSLADAVDQKEGFRASFFSSRREASGRHGLAERVHRRARWSRRAVAALALRGLARTPRSPSSSSSLSSSREREREGLTRALSRG